MPTPCFCVNFDSGFLVRGLSLYLSLRKYCNDFTLWVLCMDDESYDILERLALPNISLIRMKDFEDAELLAAKSDKDMKEYSAMCKPSLILYILNKTQAEIVTFLDGDLFFFNDPTLHYTEMRDASILLTPHRFPPGTSAQEKTGEFNAGWCAFRNDEQGRSALQWWREQCNAWCYARHENGRYADQGYLIDFPRRFSGTKVSQMKGLNMAYWNILRYRIFRKDRVIVGQDIETREIFPVIFYHFSGFGIYEIGPFLSYLYVVRYLPLAAILFLYRPYMRTLRESRALLRTIEPRFDKGSIKGKKGFFFVKKIRQSFLSIVHAVLDPIRASRARIYPSRS